MNNILSLNLNSINIGNGNNGANSTTRQTNNSNASALNQNTDNQVNANNNAVTTKTLRRNQQTSSAIQNQQQANYAKSNVEKQKELSKQIEADLNPSPMLSQAMLFKWDASAGGTVINVVDFKTGKVLAQIPPNSVLKIMANYQKGSIYKGKL